MIMCERQYGMFCELLGQIGVASTVLPCTVCDEDKCPEIRPKQDKLGAVNTVC